MARPAPAGIDSEFFFSRPPEEQEAVHRELAIIDQESCRGIDLDSCKTIRENYDAWRRLSSSSPTIGLKLLSSRNHSWPASKPSQPIPDNAPKDSRIPTELWNRSVALWWILNNVGQEQAAKLLEYMITPDEKYAPVFLVVAEFTIGRSTGMLRSVMDNLKTNLRSMIGHKYNTALAEEVMRQLYYEVELRSALDQPL